MSPSTNTLGRRGIVTSCQRRYHTSATCVPGTYCALDAAYYRKQYQRHEGHPKPQVVALLALARQRFKFVDKLMTTAAAYDKEILIASHLDRERQNTNNGTRAALRMPASNAVLLHLDF